MRVQYKYVESAYELLLSCDTTPLLAVEKMIKNKIREHTD